MLRTLAPLALLLAALAATAAAQPAPPPPLVGAADPPMARTAAEVPSEELPVYYVVGRRPELRAGPGAGERLGQLDFRRGVRVRAVDGAWRFVEDVETGARLGWVTEDALSNIWILIDKPTRTFFLYRGTELLRRLPADVSINPDEDKVRRGAPDLLDHYRIPEGTYFVTGRNPNSEYYRSFMLNYPNREDADRGLEQGLISRAQHRAIVNAAEQFRSPPMGTILGGAIAIHGQGSGRRRAWTRGCVALRDVHMDMLWDIVQVGTPVLIR